LGCSRASSRTLSIYPERMNIGIRALMVIFDGLQQNESPPGMPRSIGFLRIYNFHWIYPIAHIEVELSIIGLDSDPKQLRIFRLFWF